MSRLIGAVADRVLERVAPKGVASACVAPDPWRECVSVNGGRVLLSCYYTCLGSTSCSVVGTC